MRTSGGCVRGSVVEVALVHAAKTMDSNPARSTNRTPLRSSMGALRGSGGTLVLVTIKVNSHHTVMLLRSQAAKYQVHKPRRRILDLIEIVLEQERVCVRQQHKVDRVHRFIQ